EEGKGEGGAGAWHVAIAGRGEEERALRDFAAGSGIAHRVHLLGFRSDVPDILAAADIYAMPSLSEGLPLALVEAMSAGKAIVASNVGGIPEVMTQGRDGVMVPAGDHKALGAELERLVARPELRRSLGSAAREHARAHFGVGTMVEAYERLYA
ncbi:MAG: glycosyltransferase, partial [Gaiellaceae bacterium]